MKEKKILLTGANGQIGTALTKALRKIHGTENVIATDITEPKVKNDACEFPKTNSYLHKEMYVDIKKLMSKGRVIESLTKDERE